jgi:hypothetical protein
MNDELDLCGVLGEDAFHPFGVTDVDLDRAKRARVVAHEPFGRVRGRR